MPTQFIQTNRFIRNLLRYALVALLYFTGTAVGNVEDNGTPSLTPDTLFDLSLEQLMDIPVIVSASRTEQKISHSAVPVSILTDKDFHYSGVTSIPEMLRFVPGVDVRRLDRFRYNVGVRGMIGQYSDRTLVLINGRAALDPVFGTTDWMLMPVFIEDIERVEVVRGPGGAVWGANAYNGVINIITKSPARPDLNNLFSTTINEYGDSFTHIRVVGRTDRWAWRVSAGYEDSESSDAAGAGRMASAFPEMNSVIGFEHFRARDFFRSWKFDTEADYTLSESSLLRFGIGHSSARFGVRELAGYYPMRNASAETTRLFARLEHQIDQDTSAHLQWFGNYAVRRLPHITSRYDYYENDLEGQINFKSHDDHAISVGGNLRWNRVTSRNDEEIGEIHFRKSTYNEYWAGIFAVDHWTLTDRLSLETQARLDRYSGTHSDWSARSALLYALDDHDNHIVRLGASRGYRTAGLMVRQTYSSGFSLAPGFPPMYSYLLPQETLKNESAYALEAGYTGQLSERLTLRVDTYYQRMEHLIGARTTADYSYGVPVYTSWFENQRGANAYGAETELTYSLDRTDLTAWYAYNELHTDDKNADIRAYHPSRHKAGFRVRYAMDDHWTAAANYCYNNVIPVNDIVGPFGQAETYNQLDLTLSRTLGQNAGEVMVGVSDVFNETRGPVWDITTFTSYETPGRTFFARLQFYF